MAVREQHWDPLRELALVQKRMNRLFESAMGVKDFEAQDEVDSWKPVGDVYETPGALVVCLELPGVEQESIDVSLDGDELVVSGERDMDARRGDEQFHRVERSYGKFSRRFRLPSTVDRGSVEASFRDGLLRITMPDRGDRTFGSVAVQIR
jgi:HSP20 family protein